MSPQKVEPEFTPAWQCSLCGEIYEQEQKPDKCSKCNCPNIRDASDHIFDVVDPDSVKHLTKNMEWCDRVLNDPRNPGQKLRHKYVEKFVYKGHVIPNQLDFARSYVQIELHCARCNNLYNTFVCFTRRLMSDDAYRKALEEGGHKAGFTKAGVKVPGWNAPEVPQIPTPQVARP